MLASTPVFSQVRGTFLRSDTHPSKIAMNCQGYRFATDVWRLGTVRWHALTSMLKTLAAKYQSTVSRMAAKYQAKIETPHGLRTCFEARVHRDGKPDLVQLRISP